MKAEFAKALALTATHPERAAQLEDVKSEIKFRLDLAKVAKTGADRKFQIAMARSNVRRAVDVAAMTSSPAEARAALGG